MLVFVVNLEHCVHLTRRERNEMRCYARDKRGELPLVVYVCEFRISCLFVCVCVTTKSSSSNGGTKKRMWVAGVRMGKAAEATG